MSTLDWSLQQATKTTAQIAAATTTIPLTGQIVWNTDTGKYCIGDGTTALSALTFYGGISASGLTVGTTTITGGTNTKVLYNNNGVVGEYTVNGTGNVVLSSELSNYLTTAAAALAYQPLDSDLTSWASVTRAAGFDTFVTTPSSSNLASLLTDETGSGALVFGTSPTFTTDITTPLIIGGSGVGSVIQYKGTTGNGTSTVAAHQFLVGNNGALTALSILNNGKATFNSGTTTLVIDNYTLTASSSFLISSSANGYLNLSSSANMTFSAYGSTRQEFQMSNSVGNTTIQATYSAVTQTNMLAGANVSTNKWVGATKSWAAGTLATQYFNYFSANTVAFASASIATNVYGLYVEAATAGTNATITNNYAAGFGGNVNILSGELRNSGTKVVGTRDTGWTAFTNTTNKATAYDTATVTLQQLAERVAAMQAALTTHGLLGS